MPKLTQNFNISPYYDDFDEASKFFKILFRPGYSVQAREMSQIQSILQNQVEKVGDTLYADGSKVVGGEVSLNTKINSLKLKVTYAGNAITPSNFVGRVIEGQTSGARAEVVAASLYTTTEQNTLMINYIDSTTFVDDEIINTVDTGTAYFANVAGADEGLVGVTTLVTSVASNGGSVVSIDEGYFYIGGYFVYVSPQTVILDKYKNNPTYRIGLQITESIVTSVDDSSLLDNAIGSPNYTAPGANRYKIDLALSKKNFYEEGESIVSSGVTFSVNTRDNRSGTVSVTTASDHNLSVGDVIVVNGADQTEYNGKHTVSAVSSTTTFSFIITGKPASPATGDISYIKGVVDPIQKNADENFIELIRVENGEITEEVKYPVLGDIEKTLARRTYDQSGDFTVRPFSLDVINHEIQGVAGARTSGNTSTTVTANGSNFIADVNVGDVIFFSGNTSRTATVGSITNTSVLTLSSGTALGDGSDNQKIGIDSRLTVELGPGKAYVKGFEFENPVTSTLDVNKARSTRSVTAEKQGVEFGPFLKVTDLFANNVLDIGANTANGTANGSGMELLDLHLVKWPSTSRTDGTANLIVYTSNGDIDFVGIDTTSTATIANTKIGTVRVRQLDFYTGRSSTVDTQFATDATNRTMHEVYPTVFDAHLFDFRFDKATGTVGGAVTNTSVVQLKTSGAQSFPTVNCLYGTTVTVNTTYLGVTTSDTRKILSWTGANTTASLGYDLNGDGSKQAASYHALLDSPLTQQTRADSTYSIDFGVKDVGSIVKISSTTFQKAMNIDVAGKKNGVDTGETLLFDNNDDQRTLLFPFQNKSVASTSNREYKFKRTFTGTLTQNLVSFTSIGTEKFYPGTDGTISATTIDQNYIVSILSSGAVGNGDILAFSDASGSGHNAGRSMVVSNDGTTLAINVQSTDGATYFDYTGSAIHLVATMINQDATIGNEGLGKKVLVSGNTTVANVNSTTPTTTSNVVQASSGQISFGTAMNVTPGATNSLKIADVKKLVAVVDSGAQSANVTNAMVTAAVTSAAGGATSAYDITDRFIFDNGQRDNYYDYATISLKPGQNSPSGQVIAIFDYYSHEGYGPFTADSYIWSGSGNTPYTDIPVHISTITGQKFELRDVIDFRPKRIGIDTTNSTSGAETNDITTTSNVFHEKVLPDYDFTYDTDYSHYLPRKDKIALGRDRQFKVIEGISDVNPVLPPDDEDSMTLYSLEVPAYTFNPSDVKVRYIDNKRYTMRDIGKLERRIENLEYYVSLSLLEKEADGLVITDTNNNDRFKNGILVDPFAGHNIGDVFNLDYKAAIDYEKKILRPYFNSDNFRLKFDSNTSNSTLVNNGGLITLPFSSNTFISQPFTGSLEGKNIQKTFKINPFSIQSYMGQLQLDPIADNWYDQSSRVDVKINVEGQYDNWPNALTSNAHGTHWNDWEEIWSGTQINSDVKDGIRDIGDFASNDRKAKTTNQTKTLTGLKSGNVPEKIIKTIGNRVVNLSIVPKVREQTITFVAKGLKPQTNVYAFFGGKPVTANVKQASLITLSNVSTSNIFRTTSGNFEQITIQGSGSNAGNTAKVVYMTDKNATNDCSILVTNMSTEAAFTVGSVLSGDDTSCNGTISAVTNYNFTDSSLSVLSDGTTAGVFNIQGNKFIGGENLLRFCDDQDNIPGSTTSVAESIYYTKGVIDTTNENGLVSTRPLVIRREDITEERITRVTTDGRQSKSTNWLNPMAQSFFIDKNQYPNGLFMDSVTLFFSSKDSSAGSKSPVVVQIRPIVNGLPSSSTIVPGSEVVLTAGRITANTSTPVANTSGGFPAATLGNSYTANRNNTDQGSRTIFKFDHPVYLPADEYALVVLTNSNQYSIYGFDLGAKHTGTDRKITKQPYIGSFFKPSNSGAWEAKIDQGIMFQLNRCEFTAANAYARFDNFVTSQGNATSNVSVDSFKVMADMIEFKDTYSKFDYYVTDKDGTTKGSATQFQPNKNIDFKSQKQITYTTVTSNTQYANSLQMNVYFETSNTVLTPVLDQSRFGFITVENVITNGSIANDDIVITNVGDGAYTSAQVDGNASFLTVSAPDVGSNTATLLANVHANGIINQVYTVSSGSGYLTNPTVTVATAGQDGSGLTVTIKGEGETGNNMLSANVIHSSGGNMEARYISRRVTLEEGFDARDLRVYINAYKPRGSNIYIYYKVLSTDDPESFDDKPYILMTQDTADSTYSLNEDDFKDFIFKTKDEYISYTNEAGARFNTFRTFAIKIVFTLDRVAQDTFIGIPKITAMKAIALDSVGNP